MEIKQNITLASKQKILNRTKANETRGTREPDSRSGSAIRVHVPFAFPTDPNEMAIGSHLKSKQQVTLTGER